MDILGNYEQDGAAMIRGLVSPAICNALLNQLRSDLAKAGKSFNDIKRASHVVKQDAIELYGFGYPPILTFLWGLTPAIANVTGCDLLPTYCFFRIYRADDICKVHNDRVACEHSVSLTLGLSDDRLWGLEVGNEADRPAPTLETDFGDESYRSYHMDVGDAVVYQGISRRHARLEGNPNDWSAHLFLHWVDRNGPHARHAFENNSALAKRVELAL